MSDPRVPNRPVLNHGDRESDPPGSQRGPSAEQRTGPPNADADAHQPGMRDGRRPQNQESDSADPSEGRGSSYVIIGPTKSGKTTLLTAIERACQLPVDDGMDFSFTSKGRTTNLIREAYRRIVENDSGLESTKEIRDYPFDISVTTKSQSFWARSVEADAEIVMSDGPGGHLFPLDEDPLGEQFRREMAQRVVKASTIVLCVNVVDLNLRLLYSEFSRLLAETATRRPIPRRATFQETLQDGIGNRVRSWASRLDYFRGAANRSKPRSLRPTRTNGNGNGSRERTCLVADRFLLLLTQIDKLCDLAPDGILPRDLAHLIDPVAQAKQVLGSAFLRTLRNAVSPNGQMAVGICSAFGFHPDEGVPFADNAGRPRIYTDLGDEMLKNWTPFGVREAIYFVLTGNCRGTVKELFDDDLLISSRGLELIELPEQVRSEGDRNGSKRTRHAERP